MGPCCAPGCRSNYGNSPRVSVFRFPSDLALRRRWIEAVPRRDWTCSKHSVLCIRHFRSEDVLDRILFTDTDGIVKSVPSGKVTLKRDTCPSIWPGLPTGPQGCTSATVQRESRTAEPDTRFPDQSDSSDGDFIDHAVCRNGTISRPAKLREDFDIASDDVIAGYSDFVARYRTRLSGMASGRWSGVANDRCTVLCVLVLDEDDVPSVQARLRIGLDLGVAAVDGTGAVSSHGLTEQWSLYEKLLDHYAGSVGGCRNGTPDAGGQSIKEEKITGWEVDTFVAGHTS